MTEFEKIITILIISAVTIFTRFSAFIFFDRKRKTPKLINYLGHSLPGAIFGILVIYCLKDVNVMDINSVMPNLIAIIYIIAIHLYKRNMLLTLATGTTLYMILVQFIFKVA